MKQTNNGFDCELESLHVEMVYREGKADGVLLSTRGEDYVEILLTRQEAEELSAELFEALERF